MYKNYLKIAFRNLLRHRSYTFINIFGLAVGIACCMLIMLYVQNEMSYDRHYENADRVFRVARTTTTPNAQFSSTLTPSILAESLIEEFPEVTNAARIYTRYGDRKILVSHNNNIWQEGRILNVDASFLDIFSVKIIKGSKDEMLKSFNSVVVTEKTAKKYFGDEDPIGKILWIFNSRNYIVHGVVEELPENSHLKFDLLMHIPPLTVRNQDWHNTASFTHIRTYITLDQIGNPDELEAKIPQMLDKFQANQDKATGNEYSYFLQPIKDIHLYSNLRDELEANSDITYVYLFSAISLFVLLIACVNFMNLSTARSAGRAKEIGVRKVVGSYRQQLIGQFLVESIFLCFTSLLFALILVEFLLPAFNGIAEKQLATNYLANWHFLPVIALFTLIVGIIAGSYPAFFLSSFRPVSVLKGKLKTSAGSKIFRNALVAFQFAVSIILIVSTVVVDDQINFMINKRLGFAKDQVLVVERTNWGFEDGGRTVYKNEVKNILGVAEASYANSIPGRDNFFRFVVRTEGSQSQNVFNGLRADYDFLKTYNIEMIEGRFYSENFSTDSLNIVINESAVNDLGLLDPIGERIVLNSPDNTVSTQFTIIGVVKDFHTASLREDIDPLVILLSRSSDWLGLLSIKLIAQNISETVRAIENKWYEMAASGEPFVYYFLDENLDAAYKSERTTQKIFSAFSIIAIIIACLGMFGLASFTAEQKTKEISVRKILGASVNGIAYMLSREFAKFVILGLVIASPLAYYGMNTWLTAFAYRIDISIWTFFLAGGITLLIAMVTVSYQTIKAGMLNPVETLRNE